MGKMWFPQITVINVIPNWSGNIIFAKFTPVEYSILCINEYKQVFVYCMKNSNHCRDDIIFNNLMSCPTVSPISALCSYLFTDTIKPGFSQNKIKMESIIKQILLFLSKRQSQEFTVSSTVNFRHSFDVIRCNGGSRSPTVLDKDFSVDNMLICGMTIINVSSHKGI